VRQVREKMKDKKSLPGAWAALTLGIWLSGCEDPVVNLGSTIAGSDDGAAHETVVDNDRYIDNPHTGQDSEKSDNDNDNDKDKENSDARVSGRGNSESHVSADSDDDDTDEERDRSDTEGDSESDDN